MQVYRFGHLAFSDGRFPYSELIVPQKRDKYLRIELTVLFVVNNLKARKCRNSNPS